MMLTWQPPENTPPYVTDGRITSAMNVTFLSKKNCISWPVVTPGAIVTVVPISTQVDQHVSPKSIATVLTISAQPDPGRSP